MISRKFNLCGVSTIKVYFKAFPLGKSKLNHPSTVTLMGDSRIPSDVTVGKVAIGIKLRVFLHSYEIFLSI
jgi:hypothetical protein